MGYHPFHRVLDVEPESEDEDALIERRRQLRQAIMQKYQHLQPPTEGSSLATSPAKSESSNADSDKVGDEAARDLEETIHQEEIKLREKKDEGQESEETVKKDIPLSQGEEEEQEKKKLSLRAMKAAVRNGDMFSEEDMFGEKALVSQ